MSTPLGKQTWQSDAGPNQTIYGQEVTFQELSQMVAKTHQAQGGLIQAFHEFWYRNGTTWPMTSWKGVNMMKNPLDLQIYLDLLWRIKPKTIIETGTASGGSALWFADMCEVLGLKARVLTIDIHPALTPISHPRLTQIVGSSVDKAVLAQVKRLAKASGGPTLVSLDSDHTPTHVAKELKAYAPLVEIGSSLVVEDTNVVNGPVVAVNAFLKTHPGWMVDATCHRYYLTMHPGGWLMRVK